MISELIQYLFVKFSLPPFPDHDLLKNLYPDEIKIMQGIFADNLSLIEGYRFSDMKLYNIRNRHLQRLEKIGFTEKEAMQTLPQKLSSLNFPSLKEISISFAYQNFTIEERAKVLNSYLLEELASKKINYTHPGNPYSSIELFKIVNSLFKLLGSNRERSSWDEKHKNNLFRIILRFGNNFFLEDILKDVNINKRWTENNTSALHYAAENPDVEITKTLLEKNIERYSLNNQYRTPLHMAAKFGNEDVFNLLYDTRENNERYDWESVLSCAALSNNLNIVQKLLAHLPKINSKDIHLNAARGGSPQIFDLLVEQYQLDPKAVTDKLQGALHLAAKNNKFNMVKHLIEKEFDVNQKDDHSNYPLHIAVSELEKFLQQEKNSWEGHYDKILERRAIIELLVNSHTKLKVKAADNKSCLAWILSLEEHLNLSANSEIQKHMVIKDYLRIPTYAPRRSTFIFKLSSQIAGFGGGIFLLVAALGYFYPQGFPGNDKEDETVATYLGAAGSVLLCLYLLSLIGNIPKNCNSPKLSICSTRFFRNHRRQNDIELAPPSLDDNDTNKIINNV